MEIMGEKLSVKKDPRYLVTKKFYRTKHEAKKCHHIYAEFSLPRGSLSVLHK